VFALLLATVLVVRLLTRERKACSLCGRMASRTTVLATGQRACRSCVEKMIWESADRAVSQLPGRHTSPGRALRASDPEVGQPCPICKQLFQPMDPITASACGTAHLSCGQFAEIYAEELEKARQA
jgi:hypothetical protein